MSTIGKFVLLCCRFDTLILKHLLASGLLVILLWLSGSLQDISRLANCIVELWVPGIWPLDDLTESLTCSDDLIVIHVFYVMIDGHLIKLKVTTSFDHPAMLVCTRSKSAAKNRARRHVRKGWKHQRESATRGTKKAKNLSLSHFSIKQNIENKSNSPAHSSLFSIPIISVEARLMYLFFILYIAHPHESVSSFVLHLPVKVNNECTKKKNPQVFIFAIIALHLAEIYNAKNPRS